MTRTRDGVGRSMSSFTDATVGSLSTTTPDASRAAVSTVLRLSERFASPEDGATVLDVLGLTEDAVEWRDELARRRARTEKEGA